MGFVSKRRDENTEESPDFGNIATIKVGCGACPANVAITVKDMKAVRDLTGQVGQSVTCPKCKTAWKLQHVLVSGIVAQDGEEWKVQPCYAPASSEQLMKTMRLLRMGNADDGSNSGD